MLREADIEKINADGEECGEDSGGEKPFDPVTAFKIVAGREIFTINRETFDSKVLSITPDRLAR